MVGISFVFIMFIFITYDGRWVITHRVACILLSSKNSFCEGEKGREGEGEGGKKG